MKNSKFILVMTLSASVALAAGFGLGRALSRPEESGLTPQGSDVTAGNKKSAESHGIDVETQGEITGLMATLDEDGAEAFLHELLSTEDSAKRLQLFFESIAGFSSAQFDELLTYILANKGSIGTLMGDVDPITILMVTWAKLDFEAAIDFEIRQELEIHPGGDDPFGSSEPIALTEFRSNQVQAELATLSPEEALRKIREKKLAFDFESLFEAGGEINLAAVDEILRFEEESLRESLAESLFATWFRRDPEAALDGFARYLEDPRVTPDDTWYRTNEPIAAIAHWAMTDPEAALRSIDRIPDVEFLRDDVLKTIAENIAATDPDRALAILEKHSKADHAKIFETAFQWDVAPGFRLRAIDRFLEAGGQLDGEFFANRFEDPFASSYPFGDILDAAPGITVDWLLEHPDAVPSLLDPGEPYFGDLPLGESFSLKSESSAWRLGTRTGNALAAQDLQAAFDKMTQMPPGLLRDGFVEGLAERGAHIDPQKTAEFLGMLTDGEAAQATLALARGWVASDADSGMQFASSMGDEVFDQVARLRAQRDIGGTFNWMIENDHPAVANYVSNSFMHSIWIEQDAFGGAAVVSSLPPDVALEVVPTYVSQWTEIAPHEAAAYLNDSLEPGPIRDAAIVSLAAGITPDDPNTARQWLAEISDPAMRKEALAALPSP